VASSSAKMAMENNHTRPTIITEPIHDIKGGRHPVVEYMQKQAIGRSGGDFVENDCLIGGPEGERVWVMSGRFNLVNARI
jgi:DNA mismatch repair protein MutS